MATVLSLAQMEFKSKQSWGFYMKGNCAFSKFDFCMNLLLNLTEFYEKSSIDGKQQLIGSIFTGNLIFANKKVRTTKINEVLFLINSIYESYGKLPKEKPGNFSGLFHQVIQLGFEPRTPSLKGMCSTS